jgi:hypothetical protein
MPRDGGVKRRSGRLTRLENLPEDYLENNQQSVVDMWTLDVQPLVQLSQAATNARSTRKCQHVPFGWCIKFDPSRCLIPGAEASKTVAAGPFHGIRGRNGGVFGVCCGSQDP